MASTFVPDQRVQSTAFRFLFLGLAITAASIALNLAFPQLELRVIQQSVLFIAVTAIVLAGLWRGLARAQPGAGAPQMFWFVVAIPFLAWFALVWWLAVQGAFVAAGRIPALPFAIGLPVLIGLPLLLRSRRMGAVLDATPPSWLVGLQLYRVFGSIFLVNWLLDQLSGIFALPAGGGDTLVGLLALPVAAYVQANPRVARPWAVAWNVLGIVDLVDAVVLGFLSTPGPFQLFAGSVSGPPPIAVYPLVMIPAFAVPTSILLHALSLRQLRRAATALVRGR